MYSVPCRCWELFARGLTLPEAGYPGYGSAEYAAYMQSMSAAGDGGWSGIWKCSFFCYRLCTQMPLADVFLLEEFQHVTVYRSGFRAVPSLVSDLVPPNSTRLCHWKQLWNTRSRDSRGKPCFNSFGSAHFVRNGSWRLSHSRHCHGPHVGILWCCVWCSSLDLFPTDIRF